MNDRYWSSRGVNMDGKYVIERTLPNPINKEKETQKHWCTVLLNEINNCSIGIRKERPGCRAENILIHPNLINVFKFINQWVDNHYLNRYEIIICDWLGEDEIIVYESLEERILFDKFSNEVIAFIDFEEDFNTNKSDVDSRMVKPYFLCEDNNTMKFKRFVKNNRARIKISNTYGKYI